MRSEEPSPQGYVEKRSGQKVAHVLTESKSKMNQQKVSMMQQVR